MKMFHVKQPAAAHRKGVAQTRASARARVIVKRIVIAHEKRAAIDRELADLYAEARDHGLDPLEIKIQVNQALRSKRQ